MKTIKYTTMAKKNGSKMRHDCSAHILTVFVKEILFGIKQLFVHKPKYGTLNNVDVVRKI